ncbi:MAG TPA: alpha/beta hydrolase [Bradyrhizobium sp.]|nr:alpha/beta hydrolase [Bradyrhizobium sp.]
MKRLLALCFLLTSVSGASGSEPGLSDLPALMVRVGLTIDDSSGAAPDNALADDAKPCAHVSFSRNLKYGENDLNVLDVATGDSKEAMPRPVLLFVAGESFTGDEGTDGATGARLDEAACFAVRHGMVGVRMTYRPAPADQWPAGAQDVAAATSWLHQNIDLFGGNPNEIVTIGYSVGAFHVASFLAHREFQEQDSNVAAVILVSGIYRIGTDASATEKSYFGADAGKYDERSAFPGILKIEMPILLAWSALDPPRLIAQAEKLKEMLCNSRAHCPRTTVLDKRESLPSILGDDAASGSLAKPTLELVREIESRGLP